MKMRYQDVRGFRTLLPDLLLKYKHIEKELSEVCNRFGYQPIETPSLEYAEVLLAKGGLSPEQTKEIFIFKDHGGRNVGLRYDLTTPIARVIGEKYHEFQSKMPLRLYYFTKMWRYEKPQKGRYREFWQHGVELIGSNTEFSDAETIELAYNILKHFKIHEKVKIFISHRDFLLNLAKHFNVKNPIEVLRQIDKIDKLNKEKILESLKELVSDIRIFEELLEMKPFKINENNWKLVQRFIINNEIKESLNKVKKVYEILKSNDVEVYVDLTLARGFDYYTGIIYEANVFENNKKIGGSIIGGGRYDNLIGFFGGQNTPSIGFAIGVDRMIDVLDELNYQWPDFSIKYHVIVDLNQENHRKFAFDLVKKLREFTNVTITLDIYENWRKMLKKELKYAATNNIKYAIIIDESIKENRVIVKDLQKGEQKLINIEELLKNC